MQKFILNLCVQHKWQEWEEEEWAALREAPSGWGKGVDDSYKLW